MKFAKINKMDFFEINYGNHVSNGLDLNGFYYHGPEWNGYDLSGSDWNGYYEIQTIIDALIYSLVKKIRIKEDLIINIEKFINEIENRTYGLNSSMYSAQNSYITELSKALQNGSSIDFSDFKLIDICGALKSHIFEFKFKLEYIDDNLDALGQLS